MKKFRKIVLAAGTGQIGKALVKHFKNTCEELIILSRKGAPQVGNIRTVVWDAKTTGDWHKELEEADVLINLAGKNINCRYTTENKKEIIQSRIDSIVALASAIKLCKAPPALWIQSASGAIYNHNDYKPKREGDPETGEGFLAKVCKIWESTFKEQTANLSSTRKILLRISLALGNEAGAYPKLRDLVKFGLGGKAGKGNQYMSWVTEEDLANIVEWLCLHKELEGAVNCASPNALTNEDFMKVMREQMHKSIGLPAPAFAIKLGAFFMNTEAELVLNSMWQYPEKLVKSGFQFQFPTLDLAVQHLIQTK